jgi:hypothetical protein
MIGEVRVPAGAGSFSLHHIQMAVGPIQPRIQWITGVPSVGVERPGREAEDLPPFNAEIKHA